VKLVAVSTGLPREVDWQGRTVRTSIWKTPMAGPVRVSELGLEGDEQSDLAVHGGPEKAVYVYPAEHYAFWREELRGTPLPWGAFGENFTTEGLLEDDVRIGDRLRAGSAEFLVTQPRMPCFKLGVRFGRSDMVKRFLRSRRTGFYLAVVRGGAVQADDPIEVMVRPPHGVTVADVSALYVSGAEQQDLLRRVVDIPVLPEGWRDYFRKRLWEADA
jgi:MOSC domain-containing protein YiiM